MTTSTMLIGLAVMIVATYSTRIAGVCLMNFVPLTKTVQQFLRGMASTVLIAIIVPIAWEGDWSMRAGLFVAIIAMLITRKNVLAMSLGIFATVVIRAL